VGACCRRSLENIKRPFRDGGAEPCVSAGFGLIPCTCGSPWRFAPLVFARGLLGRAARHVGGAYVEHARVWRSVSFAGLAGWNRHHRRPRAGTLRNASRGGLGGYDVSRRDSGSIPVTYARSRIGRSTFYLGDGSRAWEVIVEPAKPFPCRRIGFKVVPCEF